MTDNYENLKTEFNGLKNRLDGATEEYFKKIAHKREDQKGSLDRIKEKIDSLSQIMDTIFIEEIFSSTDKWEKAVKDKKQEILNQIQKNIPAGLKVINKSLRRLENVQKQAIAVIVIGIFFLTSLVIIYMKMHNTKKAEFYNSKAEDVIISNLGQIKEELSESHVEMEKVNSLLQHFFDSKVDNDKLFIVAAFRKDVSFLKGFANSFAENSSKKQKSVNGDDTPKATPNNQTDQRIVILKNAIDKMVKEADAFSKNAGYFWIFGFWRWFEVIFWGEFGVLVGILAWVSRKVEDGEFTKERFDNEVLWYITEVFIGPVVIVAAFFLLNQFIGAMMSGVSAEDVRMSIYLTLGLSFILGLFLRRTLGIFDSIKDKLPLPGGGPTK